MIACLDYGERYIGIAITDPDVRLALRYAVIDQRQHDALNVLKKFIAKEKVTKVLVGVPVSLTGEETDQTHRNLAFLEHLRDELGDTVAVESVDETLTSIEAEDNVKRDGSDPNESHAEAARIMLESYLRQQSL